MNKFGTVTLGCGSAAALEAFPAPLEPMFRVAAKPPCRANEGAREAKTTNSAKAKFAEMFDMGNSSIIKFTSSLPLDGSLQCAETFFCTKPYVTSP
jgi:hypothetical protein